MKVGAGALFPRPQGLGPPALPLGSLSGSSVQLRAGLAEGSVITVPLVCRQQPLRAQAVMETLLAVAARPSDGRVATVSLPLLDTGSPLPGARPGFLLAQPAVALGCPPAALAL